MRVDQSDPGPTPARGRGLLPLQPPPHLGPEHERPEEMVHDLCLQLQVSPVFSTTIGPAPTRVDSHWLRASECCLRQQSCAIKNQLASKAPSLGLGP